jgi:hypothetical protein
MTMTMYKVKYEHAKRATPTNKINKEKILYVKNFSQITITIIGAQQN